VANASKSQSIPEQSRAVTIIRRRRRRKERKQQAQATSRMWSLFFGGLAFVLIVLPGGVAMGSAAVVYLNASDDVPAALACRLENDAQSAGCVQAINAANTARNVTRLYDRSGERLIHELQDPLNSSSEWVRLDTLPQYLIDATLAVEDPDFYETTGFDAAGMLLGIWENYLIAATPPDFSIPGRLARSIAVNSASGSLPTTAERRAHEIALAAELQRRYSPEQLLEWYLNTTYYGSEAYGIEAAAQIYLGKRAVDLSLDEAALLASIPTAPQYNPFDNQTAARGRQQDTLRMLLNTRKITPESYEAAAAVVTRVQRSTAFLPQIAPDFTVYARRQAERILTDLGLDGARLVAGASSAGGLNIITTLDVDLHYQAECALAIQLARLNNLPEPNSAADGSACFSGLLLPGSDAPIQTGDGAFPDDGRIVVIDARTGELRAMVGAGATVADQPGITLLPIVYLEGFNGGNSLETPATMVFDIPTQFPGAQEGLIYTVPNPDGRFRGVMNLRDAFGSGRLPPAASVAYRQGMGSVLRTAHQIGINSLDENEADLMLLERGGAVSALDITYAYSVFASLGHMRGVQVEPLSRGYRGRDPVAVLRIEDADGNILWEYDTEDAARCGTFATCTILLQEGLAYLITDILADQETRWGITGQGSPLDAPRPTAVVNGLTGDRRDNWTVGYTPDFVVGVHLGRTDASALLLDTYGLRGSASVWRAVMDYLYTRDGMVGGGWIRPDEVIETRVCDKSGLLPNGVCPVESELFMEGTEPRQQDTYWQTVEINSQTGQRATANTAAQFRQDAVYFVPPDEAMDWWRANNQPLPPEDYDTVSRPELFDSVRILSPGLFAYVGGLVEVRGELDTAGLQYFQLSYGEGLNPTTWIDITPQQTTYNPDQPLGVWDTRGLSGLYTLLLVTVTTDNQYESEAIQVTVDNTPPTITLDSSEPGKVYRFPGDTTVQLLANVQDDYALNRVEFYHNGEFLGSDESFPFGFEWRIDGVGEEVFTAAAFDQVGNQADAQVIVQIVRAGS